MIQSNIELPLPDGGCDAVLLRPAEAGKWPGVFHLTDVGGIRASQLEMARRLAAEGYAVLVPNLYYRTSRPPVFDLWLLADRERMMKRVDELTGPLTPASTERDAAAYVDFLISQNCVPADRALGVVGYCFSGAVALRVAAVRPERIGACASFHGGGLYSQDPASPHLLLPRIKARLYFGHAVKEPYICPKTPSQD